jgi:hypothetical protein
VCGGWRINRRKPQDRQRCCDCCKRCERGACVAQGLSPGAGWLGRPRRAVHGPWDCVVPGIVRSWRWLEVQGLGVHGT